MASPGHNELSEQPLILSVIIIQSIWLLLCQCKIFINSLSPGDTYMHQTTLIHITACLAPSKCSQIISCGYWNKFLWFFQSSICYHVTSSLQTMMMSWHGNNFHITGPLCRESLFTRQQRLSKWQPLLTTITTKPCHGQTPVQHIKTK